MRRLAIALIIGSMLAMGGYGRLSAAPPDDGGDAGAVAATLAPVDVFQVSGLFDEIVVDGIEQAIDRSATNGAQALIVQLDSGAALVSRARMTQLLDKVANAPVAIGVWVGPSRGSRAYGLPAQLMAVADVTAMVPGSRLGHIGAPLTVNGRAIEFGVVTDELRSGSMSFKDARAAGILRLTTTDEGVPTVRNMVAALDGMQVRGMTLDTVVPGVAADGTEQGTSTLVRFHGLGLAQQLMHTVASPEMAYLLFLIGASLLIFEFFTAGVGVAGVVGAVAMILSCYGLVALPTRPFGLALLILAMLGFAVDTQVGVPRLWTAVGIVALVIGSWTLFHNLPGTTMRVGWLTLIVGILGVAAAFAIGMPSMTRSRFATPTIERDWLDGMSGTATVRIAPDGIATIDGAPWRAHAASSAPIPEGTAVHVVGLDDDGITVRVVADTPAS